MICLSEAISEKETLDFLKKKFSQLWWRNNPKPSCIGVGTGWKVAFYLANTNADVPYVIC
jgi:hypothetical protein